MAEFQFVRYRVEDYIGWLTLNRPPVNALNRQLVGEIFAAAHLANRDVERRQLRVLILNAEGTHFCAGADLKERQSIPESEIENVVQGIREAVQALADIKVPVIAAVQGTAAGGGMELALAADIRVLSETAQMGLRETALAIIPGAGGTQRLLRLIGYARALEWIATAQMFDAQECLSHGVANRVVPATELADAALYYAKLIAANGPVAVQAAKEALRSGMDEPLSRALELELACYRRVIPTKDRREALAAFLEKRPPVFKGE
ncbi:MAG: enoyl-CoA hydratase-related protein [candidate division KSB1 bacterium]|nr:enoyl-CoA hydratase-related protein [candidate division KSB1 bacterium]MDZ7302478.1 enoyl-CoA hydratase-related protein [candidate division KSB1 bacterium]MDZ7311926.1 enoyl-CoA hydratase-related protein [candidate division KSB1 bacterium]